MISPQTMQHPCRNVLLALCLLLGGMWLAHVLAGNTAAKALADLLGNKLQAAADGKFDDPVRFIHGRLREVLLLATLLVTLIALCGWIWRLTDRPGIREVRGLAMGLLVFMALNLFIWCAARTAVFWMPFYSKIHINNLVQYQIKKCLLDEMAARQRIILLGNSQANRAIDERVINRASGGKLWATEMTQPGARGFDLFILSRDLRPSNGDLVICYVSEISFYGMGSGMVAADFLNFGELPDLFQLDGFKWMEKGSVRSGLLGRMLPLYDIREPLSWRVLGWDIANIDQMRADSSLARDLEAMAREWAPKLAVGESSRFEKQSFARMIDELCGRDCKVLLIAGHLHPALREHMDEALASDFRHFLNEQRDRHPDAVTVLVGDHFFPTQADDFSDLVHFNDAAQERFTQRLLNMIGL